MRATYNDEFCLGVDRLMDSSIKLFISWEELSLICKDPDLLSKKKKDLPGFTYKGNYVGNRKTECFTGDRSPYVVVDIDFDEKTNGISKDDVKKDPDVLFRVKDDINIIIMMLFPGYFFLKRSASGCGIHVVLRIEGIPSDLKTSREVEEIIFNNVSNILSGIKTTFKYKVDNSLKDGARHFFASYDKDLIFDPSYPSTKYNSSLQPKKKKQHEQQEYVVKPSDKILFEHYADYCKDHDVRLEHQQLLNLALIYFQLWIPKDVMEEDERKHFIQHFNKLNDRRKKDRPDSGEHYLYDIMDKCREASRNNSFEGKKVTVGTLRYYAKDMFKDKDELALLLEDVFKLKK